MENRKIRKPVKKGVAKVPVFMQLETLECGAACLTMVMAFYEKWIPLEQVRSDCGVSRDGSKAKNILKAARSYGFEADAYKAEVEDLKTEFEFPCIIHWDFNHFVVLDGFRGNKAYINDPARGKVTVSMEEFDRSFTGICLTIVPGEDFEPAGRKKNMLDYAKGRLKGAGEAMAFLLITSSLLYLIGMINPVMSKFFMDRLLTGENRELLAPFIFLMILLAAIQLTVAFIQAVYRVKINSKTAIVGNSTFMWKVLRLPMVFFSQRLSGDILERQITNTTIAATLVNTFTPLLLNFVMMFFYLLVMLKYSVVLTLVGVTAIVINLFLSQIITEKRTEIARVQMRDEGKLYATTVSGIQMVETIKASGAENGFFEKWSGYQASVNSQSNRYIKLNSYLGLVPELLAETANILVLALGVFLVINEKFTLGSILTFQGFMGLFMAPAMIIIFTGQDLQEMRVDMERVDDVMRYPDDEYYRDQPAAEAVDYSKLKGKVELKNISFGYSRLDPPLIEDFSMTLQPGSRVAFVGTSGCGKSTLSKLISGLYKPWGGEILFDGKPISEIDRTVFTSSVAVVDQDIVLFEDTIENNIRMWNDSIRDFEILMAAKDAQIYDDIMARDGGFKGMITEMGKDLSGGQKQRIEIARVLAQDPSIIIMDEATSALDAKTEFELVKAVKDRGITCIVIAHRLSTIRDCDEIIVLDRGKVVERGTHEELYAKGGFYTELIASD